MNAQAAVEAPRFQTRHLVSSFDNHAWNRGDLLLDERIPPAIGADLAARGHKVGTRSQLVQRRGSGDGSRDAGRRDRGGRRSLWLSRGACVLDFALGKRFRSLKSRRNSTARGCTRKLAALASENVFIGTSSWKYEGWIGQIYSRDRYMVRGRFSEKRFQAECLSRIRRDVPDRLRRFLVLSVSLPELLGAPVRLRAGIFASTRSKCPKRSR